MSIYRRLAYSLGIKQRLLILVLLAVAPLIALIAWDVVDDRGTAIEQAGIGSLEWAGYRHYIAPSCKRHTGMSLFL